MCPESTRRRRRAAAVGRAVAIAAALVVALAFVPGSAAAQSEGIGGTVVVAEGETVEELRAVAGNVIVEGTVTGDVSALAGNVYVRGQVDGDVAVAAGNVEIDGDVGGDVAAAAGTVTITEGAAVVGDVTVAAERTTIAAGASVGGDLTYTGELAGETDGVAGDVTRDDSLVSTGVEVGPSIDPFVGWLSAAYAFVMNLLLGAILLAVFPRFSDSVADRVANDPLRSGLIGLGVLIGVPLVLVAVAITVVGVPLSLVGAFAFALAIWIGIVYGRFAVAAWLLSAVGVESRWLALVVGLVAGTVLSAIPFVGGPLNFLVFLLGLGAFAAALYGLRGRRSPEEGVGRQVAS